jgi:protein-S-isoprenylcysteine O-methyltransferase Ste14
MALEPSDSNTQRIRALLALAASACFIVAAVLLFRTRGGFDALLPDEFFRALGFMCVGFAILCALLAHTIMGGSGWIARLPDRDPADPRS